MKNTSFNAVWMLTLFLSGCATTYAPDIIGNGFYSQSESAYAIGHTSSSCNVYYKPEKSWKKTWLTKTGIGRTFDGPSGDDERVAGKLFGPNLVYVDHVMDAEGRYDHQRMMLYSPTSGFHTLHEDYGDFSEVKVTDTGILCYPYGPDGNGIDRDHPVEFKAEYLAGL